MTPEPDLKPEIPGFAKVLFIGAAAVLLYVMLWLMGIF
jgi:hypothetical protein